MLNMTATGAACRLARNIPVVVAGYLPEVRVTTGLLLRPNRDLLDGARHERRILAASHLSIFFLADARHRRLSDRRPHQACGRELGLQEAEKKSSQELELVP